MTEPSLLLWKYPLKYWKPGSCIWFYAVDQFLCSGKATGHFSGTDVEHLGRVGDGVEPVDPGHLLLCKVRSTHLKETYTFTFH